MTRRKYPLFVEKVSDGTRFFRYERKGFRDHKRNQLPLQIIGSIMLGEDAPGYRPDKEFIPRRRRIPPVRTA